VLPSSDSMLRKVLVVTVRAAGVVAVATVLTFAVSFIYASTRSGWAAVWGGAGICLAEWVVARLVGFRALPGVIVVTISLTLAATEVLISQGPDIALVGDSMGFPQFFLDFAYNFSSTGGGRFLAPATLALLLYTGWRMGWLPSLFFALFETLIGLPLILVAENVASHGIVCSRPWIARAQEFAPWTETLTLLVYSAVGMIGYLARKWVPLRTQPADAQTYRQTDIDNSSVPHEEPQHPGE